MAWTTSRASSHLPYMASMHVQVSPRGGGKGGAWLSRAASLPHDSRLAERACNLHNPPRKERVQSRLPIGVAPVLARVCARPSGDLAVGEPAIAVDLRSRRRSAKSAKVSEGQRRPVKASEGQRRPAKASEGHERPAKASEGQRRPAKASEGGGCGRSGRSRTSSPPRWR